MHWLAQPFDVQAHHTSRIADIASLGNSGMRQRNYIGACDSLTSEREVLYVKLITMFDEKRARSLEGEGKIKGTDRRLR